MSYSGYDAAPAWGSTEVHEEDIVKDALRKEQLLKDIAAAQDDLRAMLARVKAVQSDVDKLTSGNQTLQVYIDNLTLQMAKRR